MTIPTDGTYYVYIMKRAYGGYYVGFTDRTLREQVAEHIGGTYRGLARFRRPVKLVWWQEYHRSTDAISDERQLKEWSNERIRALIHGEFQVPPKLTKTAK